MIYYLNDASLNYYKKYEIAYKILASETFETLWMYTCDVHHIFSTFKTHAITCSIKIRGGGNKYSKLYIK